MKVAEVAASLARPQLSLSLYLQAGNVGLHPEKGGTYSSPAVADLGGPGLAGKVELHGGDVTGPSGLYLASPQRLALNIISEA